MRRFSVHPLQTLVKGRGPEQLDGAFAAVTAENEDARARATWLAKTLGLEPFPLDDDARTLYHAGAVIASNYLVTLYRAAASLFEDAGAPPEALVPLMRRTIENGFELTGPIARGDWETVDAHLAALHDAASGARARVPRARGGDGAVNVVADDRRGAGRSRRHADARRVGLVPTMGAFHAGHAGALRRSPRRVRLRRRQPVRQPGAVRR